MLLTTLLFGVSILFRFCVFLLMAMGTIELNDLGEVGSVQLELCIAVICECVPFFVCLAQHAKNLD